MSHRVPIASPSSTSVGAWTPRETRDAPISTTTTAAPASRARAGGQVQVAVERLEAVMVRHYASRAGEPHRHLQILARAIAARKWRGLHAVGVRDSLAAINRIGHAAVATDPRSGATLAGHEARVRPPP
jgi:hypothetical protein